MSEPEVFLKQYEWAANSRNFDNVVPLVSDDAIFWFTNGTFVGKQAIRQAFEDTWSRIKNETYTISNIQWLVNTDDSAICVYDFTSDGVVAGKQIVNRGRGTNVLKKSGRKWQIVHEHLSRAN